MKDGIRLSSKRKSAMELERPVKSKRTNSMDLTDSTDSSPGHSEGKNRRRSSDALGKGQPGSDKAGTRDSSRRGSTDGVDKSKLMSLFTDCMSALSSNKICTWNAFDIGIIDHIDDLVTLKNEQELPEDTNDVCFSTASRVVEGASKVYGYRVEAVYDKTFNVLMNIQTSEKEQKKARVTKKKGYDFTGSSTLLPQEEVTMDELPVEALLMDPFFLKISSLFDQSGPQGLLLINLLVRGNLRLSLSSFTEEDEKGPDSTPDAETAESQVPTATPPGLNKELLSSLTGGFEDLEILPELNKYLQGQGLPDLTDCEVPALENSEMVDDGKEPSGTEDLEPPEPLPLEDPSQTQEFHDTYEGHFSQDELVDYYDVAEKDEVNNVVEDLDLLNRINIININNQLSYYSNIRNLKELGKDEAREPAKDTKDRKKDRRDKEDKRDIESYVYCKDLNEELDSIELLSNYNAGSNPASKGAKERHQGDSLVNMSRKINFNELLNSFGIYLNLSSRQGLESFRKNVSIYSNAYMDYFEGGAESFGDDPMDEGDEDVEPDNFIDILKLKQCIFEFLKGETQEPEGRTPVKEGEPNRAEDTSFNGLLDFVYRKFSKNVISVHILFVCLLHVCNESNLFLDKGLDPELEASAGDFQIKFDHFNVA